MFRSALPAVGGISWTFAKKDGDTPSPEAQINRLCVKKMIWLYRLLIPLGVIPLAIGLTWTFTVIREIVVLGRGGAGLELAQALALVGGSIVLSLWARTKARQLRSMEIDRHILHLARNQREVAVADIVSYDRVNLDPEEASECLQRLAKTGIGSIGVGETGSSVFRLSATDNETTIWLD